MTRRSLTLPLATIVSLIALLGFVQAAHAGSVVWSTSQVPTLYMPQGSICTSLLYSTSINITYHADAINADTGESVCGATIPSGTKVKFKFADHTWQDVVWFSSGYNYDTPYGDWSADAAPPAPADFCTEHNFINTWGTYQPSWGRYSKNSTYVPLRVAPPSGQSVTGLEGFDCDTPSSDGSVTCTATQVGSASASFNFPGTYGKFYPAIAYDPAWGYGACGAGGAPLRVPKASTVYLWNQGIATGGYDLLRSDSCSTNDDYSLQVPAQSIQCPITIVPGDTEPAKPSISTGGACVIGTAFTLSFSSSDPNGHQLKYGVDWDADGSVDQWVPPSGYVPSGASQGASRTYAIAGAKTVKVISQNDQGASSEWTSYTFNCAEGNSCPTGYLLQGGACVFAECPSGYHNDGSNNCVIDAGACTTPNYCSGTSLLDGCTDEVVQACEWGCFSGSCNPIPAPVATLKAIPSLVHKGDTTKVTWTSNNVTSCSITSTNDDSWSSLTGTNEVSNPITSQTTFTLHCNGYAGATPGAISKSVIVNIAPSFEEK